MIKNVTVIGGGVLGSQIAYQTAYKGFNVVTWVRSEGSIERAKPKFERLRRLYVEELTNGKVHGGRVGNGLFPNMLEPDAIDYDAQIAIAERTYKNLVFETDLAEAVKDADLVIEALAEDPKQKVEFYEALQKVLPEKTIIATNSSTLLPSQLAESTGRPSQFLAMHFANNIWRLNIAEIMGHAETDKLIYQEVVAFAEAIGMVPLCLKKERAGYLLNSLLVPFLNAGMGLLVDDISDPATIDLAWKLGTGAPMGPFQILDVVGITTAYNIVKNNPQAKDENSVFARIAKLLKEDYIDKGKLGVNAGEGFYNYKED